ncbi:MAG TPA: EamA family transporter [Gaiellaceae bacterium]
MPSRRARRADGRGGGHLPREPARRGRSDASRSRALTAVGLALAASLCWGVADFGGGVLTRRLPVTIVLAVSQLAGLALVVLIAVAAGTQAPGGSRLLYGALAGAAGSIGLIAFYRGLAIGPMGVVAPISSTAVFVPLGVGLAHGEHPSGLQAAGVAFAVAGVFCASLEPGGGGRVFSAGAALALVAAVCFGLTLVGVNAAAKGGTVWATLSLRLGGIPLALAAAAFTTRRLGRVPPLRGWPALAAVGVGDTSGNLLFGAASTRGLLSVTAVLASLYPVLVVLLARAFLQERLAPYQLVGAAAALGGVALISAG